MAICEVTGTQNWQPQDEVVQSRRLEAMIVDVLHLQLSRTVSGRVPMHRSVSMIWGQTLLYCHNYHSYLNYDIVRFFNCHMIGL